MSDKNSPRALAVAYKVRRHGREIAEREVALRDSLVETALLAHREAQHTTIAARSTRDSYVPGSRGGATVNPMRAQFEAAGLDEALHHALRHEEQCATALGAARDAAAEARATLADARRAEEAIEKAIARHDERALIEERRRLDDAWDNR